MAKNARSVDKVRASRDGHEFHEAWAARKALQLLLPTDSLVGIAVEGLSPTDQAQAASETVEIADLVLYYGNHPTFGGSHRVVILQFKYSVSARNVAFRQADARKTIQKFAAAFRDYKRMHGDTDVEKKLKFELITNRPIDPALHEAIRSIVERKPFRGKAKRQASQFKSACAFKGEELVEFARKVSITGMAGSLSSNKRDLSRVLVDWSAAPDAMARARLGGMKQLVRDKAGSAGKDDNVIGRTEVLDALDLQGEDDLFPCRDSFPVVGRLVEREQLPEVVKLIPRLDKPLLIHAAGGVGKTVFLQSLSKALAETHQVVLFDCFGGGAYRAPEDARHLPKRGLIHIINNLACQGLCDPLLPGGANIEDLIEAFRRRLAAAIRTLRQGSREEQLLVFIDAIDNAAEHAKDKSEPCFPKLLLESFHHRGRIEGVQLIVSCRTHRRELSRGDVPCLEFKLEPFSPAETRKYLQRRIRGVTQTEIQVAHARSCGNPRILEHLALSDRGLLDASEIQNVIQLDDLLTGRINGALQEAMKRGYKEPEIKAFLAGLSALPPPVPLSEYADAHQMDLSAIESFAADLAPLLERTNHGLMFRDEPTETLIRDNYASDVDTLRRVAKNLFGKQDSSVYAARALPGLLQKLDDGDLLFELAFDERFPQAITSTVGKQTIRYARLKAAVLHAAHKKDYDHLVHLLTELSTIAAVNQRGSEYILEYPDLVIAFQDVDAMRRLFETRTAWPGTRHARLAITHVLSRELNHAYRHIVNAADWIYHHRRQGEAYRRDKGGPERLDIAALPLCLIAHKRAKDAALVLSEWKDWYAYEVAEHLFSFLDQARSGDPGAAPPIKEFLNALTSELGVLASALSFLELRPGDCRYLIRKLSKACETKKTIDTNSGFYRGKNYQIEDGLLKASAIAVSMKLHSEALTMSEVAPYETPGLWSFRDHFSERNVFPFISHKAVVAAAKGEAVTVRTILPKELLDLCSGIEVGTEGPEFRKALKDELEARFNGRNKSDKENKTISYDLKMEAQRFIDERLDSLLDITRAFTRMLSSVLGKGDRPFLALVDAWVELRSKPDLYADRHERNLFFDLLGRRLVIFSLWVRSDLKNDSVKTFLEKLNQGEALPASTLIEVASILSKRSHLQALAGETAKRARALIEREDEVGQRASLFAQLARAMLPASGEEAAIYFRAGLEQMDAIGSGDYPFTNELLLFAASTRGKELEERDFHTLTNICELNMPEEEEKFPWPAFARGLSKTSGCKALAKLSRWDDRSKISLGYTLLPYLTALIEDGKIEPETAVALLRLSDPVELYGCDSATFAKVIHAKKYPNEKALISEFLLQYQRNNPGLPAASTVGELGSIVTEVFGTDTEQSTYFSVAAQNFAKVRDERNDHMNYHGKPEAAPGKRATQAGRKNQRKLKQIVARTLPNDATSMSKAIDALNELQDIRGLSRQFFQDLRGKVKFSERFKYVQIVSRLENINIYTKLDELKKCREQWSNSSAALDKVYREIAIPFVQIHASDFVSHNYLSGFNLKELADLSSVPLPALALELIAIFAAPDIHVPGSVWMALASIVCEEAKVGEGQAALHRLLNSSAAKLASSVVDGAWKDGLYPTGSETQIAAGLIWFKLGSPAAADRWRAAHSIRCFARFGKWDVVDALVSTMHAREARCFQAPELTFYFLHARLWLLIALARITLDDPATIARYAKPLKDVVLDANLPHVLLRHFASQALLTCAKTGNIQLSAKEMTTIENTNESPFPGLKTQPGKPRRNSFDQSRPKGMTKQKSEFSLEYDFEKYDVESLCRVFGRSLWEVRDSISKVVRAWDQSVKSMYDSGGRATSHSRRMGRMTSDYHLYGQQLGWNCLHIVAGQFLLKYSVTNDSYDDEPWPDWLGRRLLTRRDGLWLADGMDLRPLETQLNLFEKGEKGLVITGDKRKLLGLVGIRSSIARELVVEGSWRSSDGIRVHISSALVTARDAKSLAMQLANEKPFHAWLPSSKNGDDSEYHTDKKRNYEPWIVCPSTETALDEHDPLGADCAVRRPHFTKEINALRTLKPADPFNRAWLDSDGELAAHSEAWGHTCPYDEDGSSRGVRLVCSAQFLKEALVTRAAELLLLIKLERYEQGNGSRESRFSHTTAVLRIKETLDFEYYKGAVNQLHHMPH